MVEAVTIVRSLHILFAVLWAGAGFHFQRVSKVALEGDGRLLLFLANSRHGPYMGITSLGTVVFGTGTWAMIGGESYTQTSNMILGIGALGATVALFVGFGGHLPNSFRAKVALENGDEVAQQKVAKREAVLDRISMASIGVALLAMVTFRWF